MTAMFTSSNTGFNCCSHAAGSSSVRIISVLDTALLILAVSICVALLRIIGV